MFFSQSCVCSKTCVGCVLKCLCFSLNFGCLDHSFKNISFLFSLFLIFPLSLVFLISLLLLSFMPHLPHCVVASLSSLPCLTTLLCCLVTSPYCLIVSPCCLITLLCLALPHVASCCLLAFLHHIALLPYCVALPRCLATSLPCYLMLPLYLLASHCLTTIAPHVLPNPPICWFIALLPYISRLRLPHCLIPFVGW